MVSYLNQIYGNLFELELNMVIYLMQRENIILFGYQKGVELNMVTSTINQIIDNVKYYTPL